MRSLTVAYVEAVASLHRQTRLANAERDVAWELVASLREEIAEERRENETLRARVAVLADLADPAARAMAAAVLKDIEELP